MCDEERQRTNCGGLDDHVDPRMPFDLLHAVPWRTVKDEKEALVSPCDSELLPNNYFLFFLDDISTAACGAGRPLDGELMASPQPLAVLGVLSTASRTAWREAARATWFPRSAVNASGNTILCRFVLRADGTTNAIRAEAARLGDILLLRGGQENATWGPLVSLLLWYEYASSAWPQAGFVGKADDDIWASLPDVALSLAAALELRSKQNASELYWGVMEGATWNASAHRPGRFPPQVLEPPRCKHAHRFGEPHYAAGAMRDSDVRPTVLVRGGGSGGGHRSSSTMPHGPFPFAKGPMYFVSAGAIMRVLGDRSLIALAQQTIRTRPDSHTSVGSCLSCARKPWEDIWTGFALSAAYPPLERLAVVDISYSLFSEQWGFSASPSTILWHSKRKLPARLLALQRWSARHHCTIDLQPKCLR
jgi:hypothetical protein